MEAIPQKPFWMVYGVGKSLPTVEHPTREEAETEAKRLARANPGIAFVVLESVAAVLKRDLDFVTFRGAPARDGCVHGCDLPF